MTSSNLQQIVIPVTVVIFRNRVKKHELVFKIQTALSILSSYYLQWKLGITQVMV
jgi:hypothetical protein